MKGAGTATTHPLFEMKSILALLLFTAASAQDCASKIRDFGDCLAAAKAEAKGGWEGKGDDSASCFTDNGCEDPKLARQEERECRQNAIRDEVEADLSTCAEDKGLSLPEGFFDMLGRGRHGHKGGRGRHGKGGRKGGKGGRGDKGERGDKRTEKIAEACANAPDAVGAVAACLEEKKAAKRAEWAANRQSGSDGGRRHGKGGFAKFQECYAQLAGCEAEAEAQKGQLCECGQSLAEDQERVDRVTAALQACDTDISEEDDDSEESGEKNPLQRLVAKFCRSKSGHKGGDRRRGGGDRRRGGGDRRRGGGDRRRGGGDRRRGGGDGGTGGGQRDGGSGRPSGKGRWNRDQ